MIKHWDMAQREQFDHAEPSYGEPFDVQVYGHDQSFITINAALDPAWCRGCLAALGAPGTPALLWHVSAQFVFNRGADESRWRRYQEAMDDFLLRDAQGFPIEFPGQPGWALDPEAARPNGVGTWEALAKFWGREFRDHAAPEPDPCGIFLDDAADLAPAKWAEMGIIGEDYQRKRAAFLAGRTWFLRDARRRTGDHRGAVLVANHAKAEHIWPDYLAHVNGVTVEGDPTSAAQRLLLQLSYMAVARHNAERAGRRRRPYLCTWNEEESPLPFAYPGCHFSERSGHE